MESDGTMNLVAFYLPVPKVNVNNCFADSCYDENLRDSLVDWSIPISDIEIVSCLRRGIKHDVFRLVNYTNLNNSYDCMHTEDLEIHDQVFIRNFEGAENTVFFCIFVVPCRYTFWCTAGVGTVTFSCTASIALPNRTSNGFYVK